MTGEPTHMPLRPIERRVQRLMADGVSTAEIARRFRRTPETIERVDQMAGMRVGDGSSTTGDVLRPLERRILRWRADGVDHAVIGEMFRRSPNFVRRVEQLAQLKLQAS
jgi:hypothetical protein